MDKYTINTIGLAKRLVIKSHLFAVSMEENFRKLHPTYVTPSNIKDWCYYRNLAGEKHPFSSEIKVTSYVTGEPIIITKEYLDDNNDMRNFLRSSPEFERLLFRYPTDSVYILGLLYPVVEEISTTSHEGKILSYDESYLEPQEVTLIDKLEDRIHNYFKRYNNPGYLGTDTHYAAGLSSTLSQYVLNSILSLRMAVYNTFEVNSRYMNMKLDSELSIGEHTKYLSNGCKFWLYKNIEYLAANAGKDMIIDDIIRNVIHPMGVNVYEVITVPQVPTILTPTFGSTAYMKNNDIVFIYNRGVDRTLKRYSHRKLFYSEARHISVSANHIVRTNEPRFIKDSKIVMNDGGIPERTKHNIIYKKPTETFLIRKSIILMDTVVMLLSKYTFNKEYTVLINDVSRVVTGEFLLGMLLYNIHEVTGIKGTLKTFTPGFLVEDRDVDDLFGNLFTEDDDVEGYKVSINDVLSRLVTIDETSGVEEINKYFTRQQVVNNRIYAYAMNTNNASVNQNMDMVWERMKVRDEIDFPGSLYGENIENLNVVLGLETSKKPLDIINQIVKSITGASFLADIEDNELVKDITEILKKLSSYTVMFNPVINGVNKRMSKLTIDLLWGKNIIDLKQIYKYECKGEVADITAYGDDSKPTARLVGGNSKTIQVEDVTSVSISVTSNKVNLGSPRKRITIS